MSAKEREQLQAELSILKELRHPNIVAYHFRSHQKATQDLHIYMEYCGNGDLGMLIQDLKKKGHFAEEEFVWSVFAQIVSALYRCHYGEDPPPVGKRFMDKEERLLSKKGNYMILHRDLKPENSELLWHFIFSIFLLFFFFGLLLWIANTNECLFQSSWVRTTQSS